MTHAQALGRMASYLTDPLPRGADGNKVKGGIAPADLARACGHAHVGAFIESEAAKYAAQADRTAAPPAGDGLSTADRADTARARLRDFQRRKGGG